MSSHEQFLKDVEAELAQLNSVLQEVEEEDEVEEGEVEEDILNETLSSQGSTHVTTAPSSDQLSNTPHHNQVQETVAEVSVSTSIRNEVESETNTPKPHSLSPSHSNACNASNTGNTSNGGPVRDVEMPDVTSLMKEHEALLLEIDRVLHKSENRHDSNSLVTDTDGNDYEQFNQPPLLQEEEEEEEEVEEDYFAGMNQFVDSGSVDVERLYDVLEMNLQYQDFLRKLSTEVERRLQKNRDKQKQIGDEEDHQFLVSQGLQDKDNGRTRAVNSKIISLQRFKAPYFSNYYKIGPRMNPDQRALSTNPRYQVYQYESGWGKNDRSNLLECLKSSVIEEKMNEVLCGGRRTREEEDLELYHEQLQNSPPETLFSSVDVDSWTALRWQEVVQSLSSLSALRSGADCANQWNNYLSPRVNKGNWGPEEDSSLRRLVREHGTNSWPLVASNLGTRRKGWQCLQRYHKITKRSVSSWSVGDDKHITDAVMIYGEASFADLSYYMGDKNSDQCLQRWRYSLRPQIKRGKWTAQEDQQIMSIVSEHGFDWQKIKDVQKHRTRAQVRERVRILSAKDKSGSNGGAKHWSVEETFRLMSLIKRHGSRNWSAIRKDFQLKYTAPVLFRRWVRVQSLLNGSCKRIHLPWERTVMNELLRPKRYLTLTLQDELRDMLPGTKEKQKIEEILERCKIQGRTALYKSELKRRVQELGEVEEETSRPDHPAHNMFHLLRSNAGNIYKKAFEVGNDSEFKMYYTPPSSTTVSAFRNLLVDHLPQLQEQAGVRAQQQVSLPDEIVQNEEFGVLAARFKSLFSWPLIMGETPV